MSDTCSGKHFHPAPTVRGDGRSLLTLLLPPPAEPPARCMHASIVKVLTQTHTITRTHTRGLLLRVTYA